MEPRFFKRGNRRNGRSGRLYGLASMEPRFFKRGNSARPCAFRRICRCFNGTTFFQTWKFLDEQGNACSPSDSFNGTTFFQTWKCEKIKRMRNVHFQLQWNHVFSNVEIGFAFLFVPFCFIASMEPRFFKRGNVEAAGNRRKIPGASMEPRFFKRGNRKLKLNDLIPEAASMEPRFFKRGNRSGRQRPARRCKSFNGTTFFQTWKCVLRLVDAEISTALQWNHVFSNVEM